MNLKLAIVQACSDEGCRVKTVKDDAEINVGYSGLVKGRIKIDPLQLVAIDQEKHPHEIVWRWVRARIDKLEGESAILDDGRCQLVSACIPRELALSLSVNDDVWACNTGHDFEVHDRIVKEHLENPEHLLDYIEPIIESVYADA